jgi:hypothetical protein
MPPQCSRRSRRTASASPASLALSCASHRGRNQRREDCESRNQADANGDKQSPRQANGDHADRAGNGHHQEIRAEHAAQQLSHRRDIKRHQEKGGRRQQEKTHRKQQDDSGEQGDGIWHHRPPFLSPAGEGFFGGSLGNIRPDLPSAPLGFGRMRGCDTFSPVDDGHAPWRS